MTDQSYLLDGKDKKPKAAVRWFGRLMKLTFFISAFGLIIITVLYNMGGSNDMLKEGVTNTLSDIFGGRHVKLRRLNHMGFFPKVALDIEGVSVYNKSEDKVSVIDLRKFEAHMPFWNVATRSPKITSLYIEGLQTIKGVFFPEEFFIEKVFIDHDMDSGVANLKGKGTIGVHSWDFEIGLTASGRTGNYAYALADNSDVVFNVGDVHFEAVIRKDGSNYMKVSDINLVYSDRKIQGELVLSSLPGNLLKIKGELLANGGSTVLVPDVVMTMVGRKFSDFSGEISATKFVMDDLSGEKSVFEILNRFNELLGYERIPDQADDRLALFGGNNFNVDITLENAEIGDIKKDKIVFNVSQTNGNIRVGNVVADGEEIMPPVMLLYDYSKKILISIFQNGHFDSKVMGLWLQNIPQAVQKKGYLDIECGLGSFHRKDDGLSVDHFAINTQGGNQIGLKDSVIKSDISKLQFIEKQGKADLLKFELPGDLYNLVMGSFEKTKDGSPCSQYFSKAPEVTDGPSVDTDTVRREIRQMKRFYTLVSHDAKDDAGFAILLDGKPVKTQSGKVLLAPTQGIADLAVQEWARQVDVIDPETMPITQILNTKLDQVALKREVMSDAVMRYLDTDLLFYVASEPEGLVLLQDKKWGVWRSWIEEWFGVSVETTSGLGALKQSESYRDKVREIVSKMNDDEFTLFQILVPLTGSIILSLALLQGKAKAEEVLAATFLEEDFKETLYDAEKYGIDPHIEARQKAALRDLNACERYLMSL